MHNRKTQGIRSTGLVAVLKVFAYNISNFSAATFLVLIASNEFLACPKISPKLPHGLRKKCIIYQTFLYKASKFEFSVCYYSFSKRILESRNAKIIPGSGSYKFFTIEIKN